MIFLDANALYWYYGIEKLKFGTQQGGVDFAKLQYFLDSYVNGLAIPETCYVEILSHYKDEPRIARELLNFIRLKKIKVFNNSIWRCVSPDEISSATDFDDDAFSLYLKDKRKEKIHVEASVAIIALEIIQLFYLRNVVYKFLGDASENEKKNVINNIADFLNDLSLYERELTAALEEGYSLDDDKDIIKSVNAANCVKNKYISILGDNIFLINMFVEMFEENKKDEPDFVKLIQNKGRKLLKKLDDENGKMKRIQLSFRDEQIFKNEACEEIVEMFERKKIMKHQALYFKEVMLEKWIDSASKLEKNDIFDMLCMGCLDAPKIETKNILVDNSNYLLTFDGKMKSFLQIHSPGSIRLISRFEL